MRFKTSRAPLDSATSEIDRLLVLAHVSRDRPELALCVDVRPPHAARLFVPCARVPEQWHEVLKLCSANGREQGAYLIVGEDALPWLLLARL